MAPYRRLSFMEREELGRRLVAGHSFRATAHALNRAPSTLSRDLSGGSRPPSSQAPDARSPAPLAMSGEIFVGMGVSQACVDVVVHPGTSFQISCDARGIAHAVERRHTL